MADSAPHVRAAGRGPTLSPLSKSAARRMLSTDAVRRPDAPFGAPPSAAAERANLNARRVEGSGCPARQSPTGPDVRVTVRGGTYESSVIVRERSDDGARTWAGLDGGGGSRYHPSDNVPAACSCDERSRGRSRPS